ncbi:polysaccharide deacetylase family protein [Crassaminicella thermophila]|nr:polysaccharide deacetylase family protein [Crassaminicella thermophila]
MKKFIICIIIILIIFPLQSFAINEKLNNFIYIVVNDELVSFKDTYPKIKDSTTYVPIGPLAKYLDIHMKWDEKNNIVFLTKDDKKIILDLSMNSLYTDEGHILVDCIFVENNRTMAPYKFIANYFGYEVTYIDLGPIARAKNKPSVEDKDLFFMLQNKLLKEKERILWEIKSKKEKRIRKNSKIAYVTFDDGPTIYTQKILNILDQYDAKATFFMLSNRIKTYPTIVKKAIAKGHTVGLHGVTHNARKIYRSPNTVVSEMNMCNKSLQKAVGINSKLIRVPYGSVPYMKRSYRKAVYTAGYKMWDWNVDSGDSLRKYISPKIIFENIKRQVIKQKVPVILLHEKSCTVKALPQILRFLKENGYRIVPINPKDKPINFWNKRH